jgi:hypothetical protein
MARMGALSSGCGTVSDELDRLYSTVRTEVFFIPRGDINVYEARRLLFEESRNGVTFHSLSLAYHHYLRQALSPAMNV